MATGERQDDAARWAHVAQALAAGHWTPSQLYQRANVLAIHDPGAAGVLRAVGEALAGRD